MVLAELTDPTAVTRAMDEFDRIGRDAFLEKYGFNPATSYFIERNGNRYDSKAMVGAAHGYQFPGRGPLRPSEFSGGDATVRRKLEQLGFRMVRVDDPSEPLDSILQQTLELLSNRDRVPNVADRVAELVERAAPAAVRRLLADDAGALIVRGSSGMGNVADVPWVAVTPESWQGSAQRGYYLVYLFAADGSAVYLSLIQGTEQVRDPSRVLPKRTLDLRRCAGDQPDLLTEINLRSNTDRPKKYELGTAYAIRYGRDEIAGADDLRRDLERMVGVLRRVLDSGLAFNEQLEPVHLLFKWSADTEPRTIELHREVAETKGAVWWGAFKGGNRTPMSDKNIARFCEQLGMGIVTHAYLYRAGEAWRTRLLDLTVDPAKVDNDQLPSYYGKDDCSIFALLADFERLDPQWPLQNLVLRNHPDPDRTAGAFGNQTTPLVVFELFDLDALPTVPQPPPVPVTEIQPKYSLAECAAETGIDEEVLIRWVRALERKGQAILYGPPGTGKTFVAERLAQHLIAGHNGIAELVQFHPAYAYEDFVLGIRPEAKNGQLSYAPQDGRFVAFCDEAAKRTGTCVLVIDEINRANLAQVFGELMYLLEYRGRDVALAGGRIFRIPQNVRIIGTMNTADRSIALMDYALRRRFAFLRLDPDYDLLGRYHATTGFDPDGLVTVLREVNAAINDRNYALGISFFLRQDLAEQLEDVWRMEIEPYLEEYFFDDIGRAEPFAWERVRGRILP